MTTAPDDLAERLGDGHGRRVLLLAEVADDVAPLATHLARRAWAVAVCCARDTGLDAARRDAERAGLVADWRQASPDILPFRDGQFAVVVGSHTAEVDRVLADDGQLITR
ncbi:MAG: class I SAM-dependent methyltransferase [Aeromicrobium sp.]|uniref:class I SAM-dependent methyltransferase n=1 Tax=Aeromicrobium sp. TaxID=1871063 RepID=UPI0039E375C9